MADREYVLLIGGIYKHHRNEKDTYLITGTAEDFESKSNIVLCQKCNYDGLPNGTTYAIPVSKFFESINWKVNRFEPVNKRYKAVSVVTIKE